MMIILIDEHNALINIVNNILLTEIYMTKSNTKTNAKTATTVAATIIEKTLTIADVARELKLDPKRARAFLRKNVELYTMRKTKFTRDSAPFKSAFNALNAYKQSLSTPKTA